MQVELHLLGAPRVKFSDQEIPLQLTKSRLLLIYLAYKGTWVKRQELKEIFYSDSEMQNGDSLRYILYKIKQIPWAQNLKIQANLIRFDALTDVFLFKQAISQGDIENALQIYKNDLLEGLLLDDTPFLEDWLEIERYNLRKIWSENAIAFARSLEKNGKMQQAFSLIEKVYQINPFAEDVLHIYLCLGYLTNQQQKMIDVYTTFAKALRDEFGLEPLEQTKELAKIIHQNAKLPLQLQEKSTLYQQITNDQLIGRELELKTLHQNDQRIVIVMGEPGIGKTSLLKTIPGAWLSCFEALAGVPYWPIIEYLRDNKQFIKLEKYKDDLSVLIPDLFPGHKASIGDFSIVKNRLLYALSAILSESDNIIFDDIQWSDPSTLELIAYMVKKSKSKLFIACRNTEINPDLTKIIENFKRNDLVEVVNLGPLDQKDTKMLIQMVSPNLSDQTMKWIYDYCSGNPLYIRQFVGDLREIDHLELDKQQTKPNIPTMIRDLMRQRVNHLSEVAQRVINIASILNTDFTPSILSNLAGLSEWTVTEALIETDNAGLTANNKFIHGLVKQSINDNLPMSLKKLIHVSIAERLADKLTNGEIAEHWLAADRQDKACELWFKMAQKYASSHLFKQSIQVLQHIEENIDDEGYVVCLILQAIIYLEIDELENAKKYLAMSGDYSQIDNIYCQFVWLKVKISLIYRLDLQENADLYLSKAKEILFEINQADVKVEYPHAIIADYASHGIIREEANLLIHKGKVSAAINNLVAELDRLKDSLNDKTRDMPLLNRIYSVQEHLAYAYSQLGDFDQAVKLTQNNLVHLEKIPNSEYMRRITLYNLAIFLIDSNQLDEAIKVIYQTQRLTRRGVIDYIDNGLAIALAGILVKKKQFKQALEQAKFALPGSEHPKYKLSVYSELLAALSGLNRAKECQKILEEIASKFLNLENESYKAMFYALMYRYGDKEQAEMAKKELTKVNRSVLSRYAQEYIREIVGDFKTNR